MVYNINIKDYKGLKMEIKKLLDEKFNIICEMMLYGKNQYTIFEYWGKQYGKTAKINETKSKYIIGKMGNNSIKKLPDYKNIHILSTALYYSFIDMSESEQCNDWMHAKIKSNDAISQFKEIKTFFKNQEKFKFKNSMNGMENHLYKIQESIEANCKNPNCKKNTRMDNKYYKKMKEKAKDIVDEYHSSNKGRD